MIVPSLYLHMISCDNFNQNEDGSTKLSVLDVASHLKQMAILSALGTPVDYTPSLASRETKVIQQLILVATLNLPHFTYTHTYYRILRTM